MLTDHIKAFVASGGHITDMAITWDEQLSMTINNRLQFKSIKFLDGIKDLNKDDGLTGIYKSEADILLMNDVFTELFAAVNRWKLE